MRVKHTSFLNFNRNVSTKFCAIDVKSIGITLNGALKYNMENAMASCAAAIGIGIHYNVYGHNKEGYHCVLDGLKHIEHNKLIGVIGVPVDRIDSDILEVGQCAGENFDYIFIKRR